MSDTLSGFSSMAKVLDVPGPKILVACLNVPDQRILGSDPAVTAAMYFLGGPGTLFNPQGLWGKLTYFRCFLRRNRLLSSPCRANLSPSCSRSALEQ